MCVAFLWVVVGIVDPGEKKQPWTCESPQLEEGVPSLFHLQTTGMYESHLCTVVVLYLTLGGTRPGICSQATSSSAAWGAQEDGVFIS